MIFIVLIFGLIVGSFLNVLIVRFAELETIVATRSHCVRCKKQIAWYDLVPLLSFALLSGKCRNCKETISWQYPIVELITAVLAAQLFFVYGLTFYSVGLFIVFALLLVIAAIDLKHYVVPDEYMIPALLLSFVLPFFHPTSELVGSATGGIVVGGFVALLVLVSKERWMGLGDIGLALVLGVLTGLSSGIAGLIIAFVTGAIVGLLLLAKRVKSAKDVIPFGPFLVLGTYIAVIWGDMIVSWYLNTIGYI